MLPSLWSVGNVVRSQWLKPRTQAQGTHTPPEPMEQLSTSLPHVASCRLGHPSASVVDRLDNHKNTKLT